MNRVLLGLFGVCLFGSSMAYGQNANKEAEGLKFFESKIRPVLVERCYKCHSAEAAKNKKLQGELLLDTKAGTRKGGESGAAVVPGNVKASQLIAALRHESFKMPPDTKLPANTIADFVKWVEMGAPDPRDGKAGAAKKSGIDLAKGRQFWSFQALQTASPPTVKNTKWIRTDLDRFVSACRTAKLTGVR